MRLATITMVAIIACLAATGCGNHHTIRIEERAILTKCVVDGVTADAKRVEVPCSSPADNVWSDAGFRVVKKGTAEATLVLTGECMAEGRGYAIRNGDGSRLGGKVLYNGAEVNVRVRLVKGGKTLFTGYVRGMKYGPGSFSCNTVNYDCPPEHAPFDEAFKNGGGDFVLAKAVEAGWGHKAKMQFLESFQWFDLNSLPPDDLELRCSVIRDCEELLKSSRSASARQNAATALGAIKGKEAITVLRQVVASDSDRSVRVAASEALAGMAKSP